MTDINPLSFDRIQSYPLKERNSKVDTYDFAQAWTPGGTMGTWLDRLPNILAANDLMDIRDRVLKAFFAQKKIILTMGAHPIKVG